METHRLRTCRVKMKRPVSSSLRARGASHGQRDTHEGSSGVAVPLMSLTFFATSKPRREASQLLPCSSDYRLRSYQISMTVDPILASHHWLVFNLDVKCTRNKMNRNKLIRLVRFQDIFFRE